MATAHQNGRGPVQATERDDPRPPDSMLDRVVEATQQYRIQDVDVMADNAARSGMYNMTKAQAFTLMMIAQAEGLAPVQALKRYHIIFDRPSMRADAMQAEFQRRGGRVRWVKTTDEECILEAFHPALHPEVLTFTTSIKELIDKKVACEWNKDKKEWYVKSMYQKFPRQMLRARMISEAVRAIDPGVVVGVYTPEETRDFVEAGELGEGDPAIDVERPEAPAAVHEPNHEPKSQATSELKSFVRREIQAAKDELSSILLIEGRGLEFDELSKKLPNEFQVANGLVSDWIEDGDLKAEDVAQPNGKRDRLRVGATIQARHSANPEGVEGHVREYVRDKLKEAAEAAGLRLIGERDEAQAQADGE